jgi:Type ISP C-terminal specificity domain
VGGVAALLILLKIITHSINLGDQNNEAGSYCELGIITHSINLGDQNKNLAIKRFAYGFASEDKGKTKKQIIEPLSLFAPFSEGTVNKIKTYGEFWGLKEIFSEINSGVCLERDNTPAGQFAVAFSKEDMKNILLDFQKLSIEELRQKYKIKDNRDWQLERAYKDISKRKNIENYIQKLAYRPFDFRYADYTQDKSKALGTYLRQDFMQNMLKPNIGLSFPKTCDGWVLPANGLVDKHYSSTQSYLAPLYLYKTEGEKLLEEENEYDSEGKKPNFTKEFIEFIEGKYSPELILGYIYAI